MHFRFLQETFDRLSRATIYIDDTPAPNVLQIRSMARRLQIERGLDLLIVDYLQLITPRENKEMNMVQQVTEISRNLKSLARELNVPVFAISQLSRGIEQRGGRPKLSDLRESGSIEQDADVVIFLHKDTDSAKQENAVEIIVAKHRNGATGAAHLVFNPECATFLNPPEHEYSDTAFA
jgi:replicative DNA helicase